MEGEDENSNVIIVESKGKAPKGIEVLTALNAPNDYSSSDTLQRFTSGVDNDVYSSTSAGPSSTGRHFLSTNQIAEGAEPNYTLGQGEISGSRRINMQTNMASPFVRQDRNSLYDQQLLQTQRLFIEQQSSMKSLADTVQKLQQQMKSSTSQKRKRKHHEISSDSSESSEVESGQCVSTSDEEEVETQTRKRSDISSVERKKEKLKTAEKGFARDSDVGPEVNTELAKTVNKGLSVSVDHKSETNRKLLDKYDRPANCQFLDVPKVAKTIWTSKQTGKEVKDADKSLQRTQLYMTKGLIPLVQIMNKTLEAETEEAEEIFELALDSFKLLSQSHRDLSTQRKKLLTPAISSKYRSLCTDSTPITPTQLFGDDLTQQIKDIDESSKLGNKLSFSKWKDSKSHKTYRKTESFNREGQYNYKYKKGQNSYKSPFLGKSGPRHQINKFQKKSNLGRHQK